MCRIAGIISPSTEQSVIKNNVKEMCRLLAHGGPDDEGIYSDEAAHLVLGNRRLALLDLSPAGHMPMIYADRYVITYNGELYNHLELRRELEALGHHFNNHTDTEVILAAFAEWNSQAFKRFNGMFAFAIWDQQLKELWLVRDAAGIKPLYYAAQNGGLVFGSEVRAFAAAGQSFTEHPQWKVMLLAYGHLPEPVTTYAEVGPLPKGCFLHWRQAGGQTHLESFNHYSYSDAVKDPATAQAELQQLLQDAVQQQMLADAPVGVFLSGGLDSGIIAALAGQHQLKSLNTLSVYFKDKKFSEKKYQDLLVDQLGCDHHPHLLKEEDFQDAFPGILTAMDLPSCDGINTWFISKYARAQGLKAVLSGIGGDELFGGYPSFERIKIAASLQQLPAPAMRLGKKSNNRKLGRMAYLQLDGIKGLYLFLRGHFTPHEIAQQLDMEERQVWEWLNAAPVFMEVNGIAPGNKASWMEFNLYMQNQLLRDADIMSMQHGVEIRVPFLDHDLVKQAFKMDPAIKYPGGLPKQILINSFKHILPGPVWNRPKMGFSFPFDDWMKNSESVKDQALLTRKIEARNYTAFVKGDMRWYQMLLLLLLNRKN